MKSGNTPLQNLSTKTEVGTSRCDVPARVPAGGTNASSHQHAERCAAERGGPAGGDGAARRPYLVLILLAALFISLAAGCATHKPVPAPKIGRASCRERV